MIATLTPEQNFILSCVQRTLGSICSLQIESEMDWELATSLAAQQGVVALVYSALNASPSPVPPSVQNRLRAGYLAAVLHGKAWLEPALTKVVEALCTARLEPIVLKGAALAYTAYPEPSFRSMSDVDLLLPAEQLKRASSILLEMGFVINAEQVEPDYHLRSHYPPGGRIGFELHRHVLPESSPYRVDVNRLRERSRVARLGTLEVPVLSPPDAVFLSCIHLAYTHRYERYPLRSLTDILAITLRHGDCLDWDVVVREALISRASGAVYWPLKFARAWLGAAVPPQVLSRLAPSFPNSWFISAVIEPTTLFNRDDSSEESDTVLRNLLRELSLYTGCPVWVQLASIARSIFPPPTAVGHLPDSMTHSRLRYTLYLANPLRLVRGLIAVGRLLSKLPAHHDIPRLASR
jgi:hypothetical protein